MSINEEKSKFLLVAKRILKENLTTNPVTLDNYKADIVRAYNELITFVIKYHPSTKISEKTKEELLALAKYAREKFLLCLDNLHLAYNFPEDIFHIVESSDLVILTRPEPVVNSPPHTFVQTELGPDVVMTSKEDFYNLASRAIKAYAGEPLKRTAFINSLKLMSKMAGDTHKDLLVSIVLTKLEGNAEDAVSPDVKSVEEVIAALQQNIKAESSKVLTSRLQALRFDRTKVQDFAKDADELAENLKRSLVVEGMTAEKANSMTIDETVKMCRSCTKSDLVKAVLSATHYDDHREVVAKLILEASTEVTEKQVLAYKAQSGFRRGRGKRFQKNGYGNTGNHNNSYHRGGRNSRGYSRQNGNSYHGRGRGRGSYGNSENRSIRVIEASGNSEAPQQYPTGGNAALVPYQR